MPTKYTTGLALDTDTGKVYFLKSEDMGNNIHRIVGQRHDVTKDFEKMIKIRANWLAKKNCRMIPKGKKP